MIGERDEAAQRADEAADRMNIDSEDLVNSHGCFTGRPEHEQAAEIEPRQVDACRAWIRAHVRPTKTIRPRAFSYGLKHVVEHWTRGAGPYTQVDMWGRTWIGDYLYIANGAFIVAALREGYRVERSHRGGLNAYFNMTKRKAGAP